ncbi:RNA-directed DNA polymerase [Metapseudomonas otitidis]|uniref:RNA-directed DNA polymerase n=1 Tax=Metapseudomonas otitidis TaxID=319939 RepID=UPI00209AAA01|nr:RNA-directed DNA polymerase [Pseudomonas otitidis]MCO7557410.1 RNA-directed DNA polymerase [Pseudomonas otitidis]
MQNILIRRLNSGDTWRFKEFKLYKGTDLNIEGLSHEYRNCIAPSPITAIAESLVLALLADNPNFRVNDRVYSYLWPRSRRSGSSYEFFAEGYKRRNLDIARKLEKPSHVAIVTDIKSFYPSIDKERALSVLSTLLEERDPIREGRRDAVLSFYSQLLSRSENGIPVGCASGHVLGHLALRELDSELTEKYGDHYFRYVDDIVIVCPANEEHTVRKHIRDCVEWHGLKLNSEKTIVFDAERWHHHVLRSDTEGDEDLRSYANDIAIYLAFHPERATTLKKMLVDCGLSIPIDKLKALSSYSRFRYFITSSRSNPSKMLRIWLSKSEDFARRGLFIKKSHEESLKKLAGEARETTPNFRRWQIQRIRRVINSIFYLRNFSEWSTGEVFSAFPELVEQKALATALTLGSVNPVLPFFGRGPAAFSELWTEYGRHEAKLDKSQGALNIAEVDALTSLKLYGVISDASLDEFFEKNDSRLMRIFSKPGSKKRSNPDLSFEDELESLCLGSSSASISELAKTRHSLSEGTTLEALSLMASEYRS